MFWKKKNKIPQMNEENDCYYVEHICLPKLIIGEYGKATIMKMILKNTEFLSSLYEHGGARDKNGKPFKGKNFNVQPIVISDDLFCLHILPPPPQMRNQCEAIYIIHDKIMEMRRFFTVEMSIDEDIKMICEWDSELTHKTYGQSINPLEQIIKIVMGKTAT